MSRPFILSHTLYFSLQSSQVQWEWKRGWWCRHASRHSQLNVIADAAAAVIIIFLLLSSTSRLSSLLLLFNERDWNEVDTGYISMHLSIFNKWSVQFFDIFKIICSCRSFALSVYISPISPSHLSVYLLNVDAYTNMHCSVTTTTAPSSHLIIIITPQQLKQRNILTINYHSNVHTSVHNSLHNVSEMAAASPAPHNREQNRIP